MVAHDPVDTTGDIYSVNSSPAGDSGLCRHQGLVTFQALFPQSSNSAMSHTPEVHFASLQKWGWGESFLPQSSSPPSLSPIATRKSSALYSEQKAGEGVPRKDAHYPGFTSHWKPA